VIKEVVMVTSKLAVGLASAFVLTSVLGAPLQGTSSLHTTHLTFSVPVALPGVTLAAGTYVFEQLDNTSPDVVVVRNTRGDRVLYLGFTGRVARPSGMSPKTHVTLGEARRGAPPRVMAWYPAQAARGYEFLYSN
jgi:hypothetical protein